MNCRHCRAPLDLVLVDLGHQPPSNAYLNSEQLEQGELRAPLKVYVCTQCWLVQLPSLHRADELFTANYAYFSSVSSSWREHARQYVELMIEKFRLGPESFVVEVASNDGYLLQFIKDAGIPCLGIEPTSSTASAARAKGIDTLEAFFGEGLGSRLAAEGRPADLMVANNVLAHVPDIDDFVAGFRNLLAPNGVATFEFPHLLQLIDGVQFDTIYHEHYSYLSFSVVRSIFDKAGLKCFDVEELRTHGGSLRVFAAPAEADCNVETPRVAAMLAKEGRAGVGGRAYYGSLQSQAERVKIELLSFLIDQKRAGRVVAAYGAAAKGNTLLNYCGIDRDLLAFVCDAAPSKQGLFLPGSHIPILHPNVLRERRPDFILVLPWNIRHEIVASHGYATEWGGRFVVAVPSLQVLGNSD